MALKKVILVRGKRATVSEEFIARWPEDIKEVLPDDAPTPKRAGRGGTAKTSTAKKPSQKPAPEVPESHVGTGDAQKDEAS